MCVCSSSYRTPISEGVVWKSNNAVSVERNRRMLMSEMSWQSSDRYIVALPDRYWKTRTATLKWTRCCTGNQCNCRRMGVMWSGHREPVTSSAAAFWTDCTRHISPSVADGWRLSSRWWGDARRETGNRVGSVVGGHTGAYLTVTGVHMLIELMASDDLEQFGGVYIRHAGRCLEGRRTAQAARWTLRGNSPPS